MCRSLGEECLGRGHTTDKGPEATCAWHERADVSGEGEVSDGGWERHTRGPWRPRGDGVPVGASHREPVDGFEQETVGSVHSIAPL